MALPLGTTADNLRTLSRWTLLAMVMLSGLTLWWPSLPGWGALIGGALALWVLWLWWRTVAAGSPAPRDPLQAAGGTDVPGHVIHLALLGVVAAESYHLTRSGLGQGPAERLGMNGQFDISLVAQMALAALLVMLMQDLLGSSEDGAESDGLRALMPVVGLAFACGAAAGAACSRRPYGEWMLGLMGLGGLAMFAASWPRRDANAPDEGPARPASAHGGPWLRRRWRWVVLTALAAGLVVLCPRSLVPALAAGGTALLIAAMAMPGGRLSRGLAGAAMLAAFAVALWRLGWAQPLWSQLTPPADGAGPLGLGGWLGRGEACLGTTWGWSSGLRVLTGMIGPAGLAWLVGGMAVCLVWALAHARRTRGPQRAQAVLWTLATGLATAAMLSPGGLFTPAVTVQFAFAWALLPARLGQTPRRRSGWWVLAAMVLLGVLFGLAREDGLLSWIVMGYQHGDVALHMSTGLLITQVLLWLVGRTWWAAMGAIGASMALAIGAELAQYLFSTRTAELNDVLAHTGGIVAAGIIYALCRAAPACESPDARAGI